jgi:murein DD-endopeptidase MepM/ murein hydrolase activator NlpD
MVTSAQLSGTHRLAPRARRLIAVFVLVAALLAPTSPAHAATIAELQAQLSQIRSQLQPVTSAYDAAETTLQNTQYRIQQTNARITSASAKLMAAQDVLGARADALYRAGGDIGVFQFILGATTWDDLVTRMDYITMIADSDATLVRDVKDARAALQVRRTQLTAVAAAEKKDLAATAARQKSMETQLAAKKLQYDRLLAAIGAQSGGKYPPGPNGLIFPVRGIHAYSDTWGAPRSGGRHHMGTDIMSPRGTPVVAVANGVARPHWITLTADNGWDYYYAHLTSYAVGHVRVKAGQVIGYVGNTGDAAGGPTHLHFQMGPHGRWVDPYPYLRQME